MHTTKIIGKLAAREILMKSKLSRYDPSLTIQKIIIKEPEILNHIKIYLSKRNHNNYAIYLP